MKEKAKIKSLSSMISAAFVLLIVAAILLGCSNRPPPPPPPPTAPAQNVVEQKDEMEEEDEEKEKIVYFYSPIGKRDPFRPFYVDISAPKSSSVDMQAAGPITILETYELQQLSLIAIITGLTTPRAMVTTPDGKGFIIKPGTPIGKHGGRISAIKRDSVVIEEEFIGTDGSHHVNKTVKELYNTEETL